MCKRCVGWGSAKHQLCLLHHSLASFVPARALIFPVFSPLVLQLVVLPPVHELQRGEDTRYCWINYSAFDAKSTFDLYQRLREELRVMPATLDPAVQADYAKVGWGSCLPSISRVLCGRAQDAGARSFNGAQLAAAAVQLVPVPLQAACTQRPTLAPCPSPPPFLHVQAGVQLKNMWDVYCHTWLPFGGLLTDMEAVGMAVDRQHLAAAQEQAETDQQQAQERFRWAAGAGAGAGARVLVAACWRTLSRQQPLHRLASCLVRQHPNNDCSLLTQCPAPLLPAPASATAGGGPPARCPTRTT